MNRTEILKFNSKQFLNDVASVSMVCVITPTTNTLYRIRKSELLVSAEHYHIQYIMTDRLYENGRTVMLIH